MYLELRLAFNTNDQLPIECNSPPPTLSHDSRAVVCSMNSSLAFASHQDKYGVVAAAILRTDTMDD